jgi:hypothetical protein
MHKLLSAGMALALLAPHAAQADTAGDIESLKQEIQALRQSYEARLQALEQRLKAAEQAVQQAGTASAPAAAPIAAAAATVQAPPPAPSAPGANANSGAANSFNPALSLILSGLYTRTTQDPADYAITGFALPSGAEAGPGTRGFSLAESELGLAANIDPWWRGAANISLHADNSVSVEEAYVQTTALGNGFTLKAGRFYSGIGYLNEQHSHTWDFVDNPLAYQAFLGTQYNDDGMQMRWLAPTETFLEFGGELGRGLGFPATGSSRNGAGMRSLFVHVGGDVGDSSSWRAGVSVLDAKAGGQALATFGPGGGVINSVFNGSTRVLIGDFVWKWAPNGNATRTSFKLQGEVMQSKRDGMLAYDVTGANGTGVYSGTQTGWFLQGVYQFMPRWRVGLRTEQLDAGGSGFALNAAPFGDANYRPRKDSLMVDYSASEFSRLRLQLARDRSREGAPDNQIFLQYQMSLGAHGAHNY